MASHPCGCDLLEEAAQLSDPRGRAVLERDARIAQRAWACPHAGLKGAPHPDTNRTLAEVSALVGAEEGEIVGCPGACVRRPEAHEAVVALQWWKSGQLQLRQPYPSAALCDAVDLVNQSAAAREAAELRRAREEAQRGRAKD